MVTSLFWRIISDITNLAFFFGTGIYILLQEKHWQKLASGVFLTVTTGLFLKYLFAIPRTQGFGPAFPSLHAMTVFFIAMMMLGHSKKLVVPTFAAALLVSYSRIHLGYHSIVDVVVGMLLGSLMAVWMLKTEFRKLESEEMARQIVHVSGALVLPAVLMFGKLPIIVLIALISLILFFLPLTNFSKVNGALNTLVREEKKSYHGAIFFGLSALFSLVVFPENIAFVAILSLCFGDSMATIYGKQLGWTKLPFNKKKTLEGFFACFMASFLVSVLFFGREVAFALALASAFIEALPLNDNLAVPIGVGSLAWLITVF